MDRIRAKEMAMRQLYDLVTREDRHAIPVPPKGFEWECVAYSGPQYNLVYFQLRCVVCGKTFPETKVMCEWPAHEDENLKIAPPPHECV